MAYTQGSYRILQKRALAPGVFDFWVHCPEVAAQAVPGQFVHIRVRGFTLRRPISICEIDRAEGSIRLVFEVRGEGTRALSLFHEEELLDLLGPLGNGFSLLDSQKKVLLIGGGIGVPPLLAVGAHYGKNATVLTGFRSANHVILTQDFQSHGCAVQIATDDGTLGHHGFVTQLLEQQLRQQRADLVCACGPMPMLKGVVHLCEQYSVPSEVSLEERMGCGIGACLVCACKTVKDGREIFAHVCKDGPVFCGEQVVFE